MIPFPILSSTDIAVKLKIKKVAAGEENFAFLTEDGDVYTVGTNTYGQCGVGNTQVVSTPVKVLSGIRDIFCGDRCTFVIRESDGLIMASGAMAATGFNSTVTIFETRANLNTVAGNGIKKICASRYACAVMTNNNSLYTCGTGYLGSGYVNGMQTALSRTATNCYDMSVTDANIYYRDNNNNLFGVGEVWGLNLPYTSNNQATWASQYGGLYAPMYLPELKTNMRCCLMPGSDRTYCVGIAGSGQLGNNNIQEIQGNRVYPVNSYLMGSPLFFGSSRGSSVFCSMIVLSGGIYFTGATLNNNSGFPSIPSSVGTYRTIPLETMLGDRVFNASLVQSLETNKNCTYLLYDGELYVTGRTYDNTTRSVFTLTSIQG